MRQIAFSEPVTSIELLSIKNKHGRTPYVLPLESDDVDVLRNSPLSTLLTPEDDLSEVASNLMGPGPWTFNRELKLPSCSLMHFTNNNRRSNIVIRHYLRWTVRVEPCDDLHLDPETGERKFYNIVILNPIVILSVSCCSSQFSAETEDFP